MQEESDMPSFSISPLDPIRNLDAIKMEIAIAHEASQIDKYIESLGAGRSLLEDSLKHLTSKIISDDVYNFVKLTIAQIRQLSDEQKIRAKHSISVVMILGRIQQLQPLSDPVEVNITINHQPNMKHEVIPDETHKSKKQRLDTADDDLIESIERDDEDLFGQEIIKDFLALIKEQQLHAKHHIVYGLNIMGASKLGA